MIMTWEEFGIFQLLIISIFFCQAGASSSWRSSLSYLIKDILFDFLSNVNHIKLVKQIFKSAPQIFRPLTFQPRSFQPWIFEPCGWKIHGLKVWGWKIRRWNVISRRFQPRTFQPQTLQPWTFQPHGSKIHGWKVHGWKVWGWKVRGWILGLRCSSTFRMMLQKTIPSSARITSNP